MTNMMAGLTSRTKTGTEALEKRSLIKKLLATKVASAPAQTHNFETPVTTKTMTNLAERTVTFSTDSITK